MKNEIRLAALCLALGHSLALGQEKPVHLPQYRGWVSPLQVALLGLDDPLKKIRYSASLLVAPSGDGVGLVDTAGAVVLPPVLWYATRTDPANGMRFVAFQVRNAEGRLENAGCFIDSRGRVQYGCWMNGSRHDYEEGTARNGRFSPDRIREGLFALEECLIQPNGTTYYCIKDGRVEPPSHGIFRIRDYRGNHGYLRVADKSVLVKPQFSNAYDFSDGRALVEALDQWVYLDTTGSVVLEPPKGILVTPFHGGTAWFSGTGEITSSEPCVALVNKNGSTIKQPGFVKDAGSGNRGGGSCRQPEYSEGLWKITFTHIDDSGLLSVAYVDTLGNELFRRPTRSGELFHDGMAAFRDEANNTWGFWDRSGRVAIAPRFTGVEPFIDGFAFVVEGSRGGWIDRTGRYVWRQPLVR